jgi:(p)ppGpp synthase/HD superfamily hydrolase
MIMERGKMLNSALVLATNAHADQFDRVGKPYILHVLKVMHYLKSDDEELQCIAVLHDIVEDTKTTYSELRSAGMSERVISAVKALTKLPGQTLDEYKEGVFANRDAMLVKLCDLRHNSDIRRLKGITEKDLERMQKYHQFYLEIKERL